MVNYLVLLRHGESQWNLENRFTGFTDVELSENGVNEAAEAGKHIAAANIKFDRVFTSTLKRAYHTAEIALDNCEMLNGHLKEPDGSWKMTRHDDLRERDYGDLVGQNKDEARAKFGEEQVYIWRRSYDVPPPGGECLKDVVEKRVRPYYEAHIKPLIEEQEQNILIAAHGNSLRAMLIILGENTPENINSAEMPTGVPLVFEFENGKKQQKYFLDDKAQSACL